MQLQHIGKTKSTNIIKAYCYLSNYPNQAKHSLPLFLYLFIWFITIIVQLVITLVSVSATTKG